MRILITGGINGYIGSSLDLYFQKEGFNILLASRNISNNHKSRTSTSDLVQVLWDDQDSLNKACSGVDVVIHAAGMNKHDCYNNPFDAVMFNGIGTANLVNAAASNGVRQFIYLSSYHVYSNLLRGEMKESDCPCNTHSYAVSHRIGEDAVIAAGQQGLLKTTVLRMSNGFGTPSRPEIDCWSLFVNDLCRQAVETNKLLIKSNNSELRNFIAVREICNILDFLIKKTVEENLVPGPNLINIGGSSNTSLLEMAKIIQYRCSKVLGREIEIITHHSQPIKPADGFFFNLNKLYDLGYTVKFDIESEIDNLLGYCQVNFGERPSKN